MRIHHYDRDCTRMVDGELRLDEEAMSLDAVGNRKNTVPSEIRDGRLRFTTSVQQPFGACFHYEVAVER